MKLPPLPEHAPVGVWPDYSADQMRDYGRQCYRAGQEATKESVADMAWDKRGHFASDSAARAFAELVRALSLEEQP